MMYFIRHAQTEFNVKRAEIKKKYVSTNYRISNQWLNEKFDLCNMDTELTENGKLQAYQCRQRMAELEIDLVLVSPLRRTMQTADIVFGNHKSKPNIVVEPSLREYFQSTCDIGGKMVQSMKEFNYFDFSLIKDPQIWYVYTIFDQQVRNRFINELQKLQDKQKHQRGVELSLQFLKEWHHRVIQDPNVIQMMYKAMRQQFDYIVKRYAKKDKNLAIVSHSQNLKVYFSKAFSNCEILPVSHKLL